MTTEDALWCAVCARLDDALPRGVLADWYDERNEPGDADTAAGLRATADRVPVQVRGGFDGPSLEWRWFRGDTGTVHGLGDLPPEVFDALAGGELNSGGWCYFYRPTPTARAALEDLCRAWAAVEREKCGRCGGAGQVQVYTRDGDYTVEDCWDCSGRAAQGTAGGACIRG